MPRRFKKFEINQEAKNSVKITESAVRRLLCVKEIKLTHLNHERQRSQQSSWSTWRNTRKESFGEEYEPPSLTANRNGLGRYFLERHEGENFDIRDDIPFILEPFFFLCVNLSFILPSFLSVLPSFRFHSFKLKHAYMNTPLVLLAAISTCTFSLLLCAYFLWHQVGELRTFYLWSSFTIFSWPECLIREWYGKEKLHADHYWSLRVWYGIAHYWAFWWG